MSDPSRPDSMQPELPPEDYAPTLLPGSPILQGKLPDRVGRFEIKRLIGEGGMGVVGLGVETEGHAEKRRVAVKFLKREWKGGSLEARIFEQECKSLARFNHDNIARFIDFGYHQGNERLPFIVMEFVEEARRITDHCAGEEKNGTAKPLPQRLGLFLRVCEGIRHAHERNVIHRDISAKNVLVGRIDQKPVVKIIDFGISLVGEDKDLGEHGAAGTPAYMSPEQLEGDPALVDQRSDIYALGILLCELLVGRRPHDFETNEQAKTALQALRTKQTTAVVPSRLARELSATTVATGAAAKNRGLWQRLARELRGDIDAIVARATALNPDDRYSSVGQMIEDVEEHLRQRPLRHAIKPSSAVRAVKFMRRNGSAVAAAAVILLLLAGLAASAINHYQMTIASEAGIRRVNQQLEEERSKLDGQNKRLSFAQMNSYSSILANVPGLLEQGKRSEARAALASTRHAPDKGWEWDHLLEVSDPGGMTLGQSATGFLRAIDAGPAICAVAGDHSVWFWQAKSGEFMRANAKHEQPVLALGADREVCLTLDQTGRLISWSLSSGEFRAEKQLAVPSDSKEQELLEAVFEDKTGRLAVRWKAGGGVHLGIFDGTSARLLCQPFKAPADGTICWRPDGTLQMAGLDEAAGQRETRYRVLKLGAQGETLQTVSESSLAEEGRTIRSFPLQMISAGGREILRFADGLIIAAWSGQELLFQAQIEGVLKSDCLAVTTDGSHGVFALPNGVVYSFDCHDSAMRILAEGSSAGIGRMSVHSGAVRGLHLADRGELRVVSASADGTVRVWEPSSLKAKRLVALRQELLERFQQMPPADQTYLGSALIGRLESAETGWCRMIKDGDREGVLAVFDAPPWILRTGCGDTHVDSCSPVSGLALPAFLQVDGTTSLESAPRLIGAGASADGRCVAVLRQHGDKGKERCDLAVGDLLNGGQAAWISPSFVPPRLDCLAVSEDGSWVAVNRTAQHGKVEELVLWDFRAGLSKPQETVLQTNGTPLGTTAALRFSRSGLWLAAGNTSGTVFLWQPANCKSHPAAVSSTDFPSGIRALALSFQADKIAAAMASGPDAKGEYEPAGLAFASLTPEGAFGVIMTPVEKTESSILSQDICWNPAGDRIATADNDGKLRIWAFQRDQSLKYCRRVMEFADAHRSEFATPLKTVFWSADGLWLAASNADEGCYLYHGAESDADAPRRRVELELEDLRGRVTEVAELNFSASSIPELTRLDQTAVIQAMARIGAHPDEVTRWGRIKLMRIPSLSTADEQGTNRDLREARKKERETILAKLLADSRSMADPARYEAIALAYYRLNQHGQARDALARSNQNSAFPRLLNALMHARDGSPQSADSLLQNRPLGSSEWWEPLWNELEEILKSKSPQPSGD